jgi:hypothetical protein
MMARGGGRGGRRGLGRHGACGACPCLRGTRGRVTFQHVRVVDYGVLCSQFPMWTPPPPPIKPGLTKRCWCVICSSHPPCLFIVCDARAWVFCFAHARVGPVGSVVLPHTSVHHVHATGLQPCASCLLTCPTASTSCVWGGLHATGAPCPTLPHDPSSPPPPPLMTARDQNPSHPWGQPGLACCTLLATSCLCAGALPPSSLYPGTPHRYHGAWRTPCARFAALSRGLVRDRVGGGPMTPWPPLPLSPPPPVSSPFNPTPHPRPVPPPWCCPVWWLTLYPTAGEPVYLHTHTVQEVCTWGIYGAVVWCDGVPRWTAILHLHSLGPWGNVWGRGDMADWALHCDVHAQGCGCWGKGGALPCLGVASGCWVFVVSPWRLGPPKW